MTERVPLDRHYAFHSLRHGAITNVYRATRDLFLAQRFARHASPLTTIVYTHPADEELRGRAKPAVLGTSSFLRTALRHAVPHASIQYSTPSRTMGLWRAPDLDSIRKRYDRLAPIYPLFEYVFWLPNGVRSYAVRKMELALGDRVLEVGCGTGRNFEFLIQAVGARGHIYGVDISEGMLQLARRKSARSGWSNVTLLLHEASEYDLPEPADGALFSFSYEVIPRYRDALRWAWSQLRPGGHLVILGQKTPRGVSGKWLRPLGIAVSRATVLGDPDRCPWDDLRELTGRVDFEELRHGYYVCRGTKGEVHTPRSEVAPPRAASQGETGG